MLHAVKGARLLTRRSFTGSPRERRSSMSISAGVSGSSGPSAPAARGRPFLSASSRSTRRARSRSNRAASIAGHYGSPCVSSVSTSVLSALCEKSADTAPARDGRRPAPAARRSSRPDLGHALASTETSPSV